jgi:ferrous iron transport protein B
MTTHKLPTVALIGNPNCGKTALFNLLTGLHQRVGNWSGVTVDRKSGQVLGRGFDFELVDLPGTYALTLPAFCHGADETIAIQFLQQERFDLILNIVDATHLERHLYLTLELLEMGLPVLLVVNMVDLIDQQLPFDQFSKVLQCPVVGISATKHRGIQPLITTIQKAIESSHFCPAKPPEVVYPPVIQSAIEHLLPEISTIPNHLYMTLPMKRALAVRCIQTDTDLTTGTQGETFKQALTEVREHLAEHPEFEPDILIAKARYETIHQWLKVLNLPPISFKHPLTEKIDKVVLHRYLGIPVFLLVMYSLFVFAIHIGGLLTPFFEIMANTVFVKGVGHLLLKLDAPSWAIALLANGVGTGISTTISFIPVIGAMFFFLSLLEGSGYMARAAVIVDRFMRFIGLPGKSFVPMIIGFGCNVPAIMATRSLENKRDRILTVLMSPFMSCGARLAIYTLFVAAFFPDNGHNIVFLLYLTGILMATITGLLLKKTLLKGESSPLILELPSYHFPQLQALLRHAGQRLQRFIFKAGKLIVPLCLIIGMLNALGNDGKWRHDESSGDSLLSSIGRSLTPLFSPMGIEEDNWPATVGLLMGVLAKEVVVGTMNALYSQELGLDITNSDADINLVANLKSAFATIPEELSKLSDGVLHPLNSMVEAGAINESVFSIMRERFHGQAGAFAYLLFVLLYFPCVSATGAMLREVNRFWTLFSVVWTTAIAYAVAVIFYQVATFTMHPYYATTAIVLSLGMLLGLIFFCVHLGRTIPRPFPTRVVLQY